MITLEMVRLRLITRRSLVQIQPPPPKALIWSGRTSGRSLNYKNVILQVPSDWMVVTVGPAVTGTGTVAL
jgi:hypothetical protein